MTKVKKKEEVTKSEGVKIAKKAITSPPARMDHINELWDIVDEMQENLNFINDKVSRILSRMGLE